MNLALFGGTFDPVHLGHLQVARAARERYKLERVYFVPAWVPPHKAGQPVTAFSHRYAMLALATAEDKSFIPSLLEAPERQLQEGANYTIDTVRSFRRTLGAKDRLFFLIGIDAFLDVGKWREAEALLAATEFIVVSRPGFSLADVGAALPEPIRPLQAVANAMRRQPATGDIVLPGANIHLLEGLAANVSATHIRQAAARGRRLDNLVGPSVAAYIRKQGLYRDFVRDRSLSAAGARNQRPAPVVALAAPAEPATPAAPDSAPSPPSRRSRPARAARLKKSGTHSFPHPRDH